MVRPRLGRAEGDGGNHYRTPPIQGARVDRSFPGFIAEPMPGMGPGGKRAGGASLRDGNRGEEKMMEAKQQCSFFLLRYAPDAVKNEFINFGLVLLPQAAPAELRFSKDWSRVRALHPQADLELLEALENELRDKLQNASPDRDAVLKRIEDSFSNAL